MKKILMMVFGITMLMGCIGYAARAAEPVHYFNSDTVSVAVYNDGSAVATESCAQIRIAEWNTQGRPTEGKEMHGPLTTVLDTVVVTATETSRDTIEFNDGLMIHILKWDVKPAVFMVCL